MTINNFTDEEEKLGCMLYGIYYDKLNGLSLTGEKLSPFEHLRINLKILWIRIAIQFRESLFNLYGVHIF